MRRARIVHLVTRLELGGAQQNTLFCVEHHDRERFDVGLIAGSGGRLDARARAVPSADVRLVPWLRHPIAPMADATAVFRLARRLAGADLVHTHSSKAGILGRAAARLAGVPAVVHTVHGWSFNPSQTPPARAVFVNLERAAARVTDRLICVAAADRETGISLGIGRPEQYRIVRSGIDVEAFRASPEGRARVRRELGLAEDEVVAGTIANFKPQKAPLDFVAAAAAARARDPRLRFVFVGDGELRYEVERAVASAGLTDAVRLLGWRDDVRDVLSALDIFLLTSLFEGLPRALLQAMAAGLPAVVTDTGGTAEVVDPGRTGLLVRPGDAAGAARAVVELAADPARRVRMGGAARSRLGPEFDARTMLAAVESIYEELLATATAASHLGAAAENR